MKPSKDCIQNENRLVDYAAGELSAEDRSKIDEHVENCTTCRKRLTELEDALKLVDATAWIDPPEGFVDRIISRAKLRASETPDVAEHVPPDEPRPEHRKPRRLNFGTTIPEPRFALSRPMRFSRIALIAAAALVLLAVYLGDNTTERERKPNYSIENVPHFAVVDPGEHNNATIDIRSGDLLEYPSAGLDWMPPRLAGRDPVIDPLPEALTGAPKDWPPLLPDASLPDIMEIPTERLPVAPTEQIALEGSVDIFIARTNRRYKTHYLRNVGGDRRSPRAQQAIGRALTWLKWQQAPDGQWKLPDTPASANGKIDEVGLTAYALLAFLGDGHTPGEGRFRATCRRGINWLLTQQQEDGQIGTSGRGPNHALAATALAEAYAMTRDRHLRPAAQRAMAFVLNSNGETFQPKKHKLTDVLEMTALRTGELAGLDVPPDSAIKIRTAMADVPASSAMASPKEAKPNTITSQMLSCMYLPGENGPVTEAELRKSVAHLVNYLPKWSRGDIYYWYCGTSIMRRWLTVAIRKYHQGPKNEAREMVKAWKGWNEALRETLLNHQETKGRNRGTWEPKGRLCRQGGRVMATALSALTLESYYRFVPSTK